MGLADKLLAMSSVWPAQIGVDPERPFALFEVCKE